MNQDLSRIVPNDASPRVLTRRRFLADTALAAGLLTLPPGLLAQVPPEHRQRIEAALPDKALAAPRKPRRLLIFNRNVNYGGHPSAQTAAEAFTLMGRRTGAFETEISTDPAVFHPDSLRNFDAVFFNNNVGNLFTDPVLRQSLVDFIYRGGGMLGVHGTAVAFTRWPGAEEDWPEFGIMLGGRGANHRDSDEYVIMKLDDPDHPVNRPFNGRPFTFQDEFFRVHGPYSRDRVRVLLSFDTEKTNMNQGVPRGQVTRDDNDYAVAWLRGYGRGRTFYCTIAHNPYVFWHPTMLRFYLAATQFALGDLPGPTTPSARLTPAVEACEKLDWRLGLAAPPTAAADMPTLYESIDKAAQLGLLHVAASSRQPISPTVSAPFGPGLTDDQRRDVRLQLDQAGVRLLTWRLDNPPTTDAGWNDAFAFARCMGVEAVALEPGSADLHKLDDLCQRHEMHVALSWPRIATPDQAARRFRDCSPWVGAAADDIIDPPQALQALGDRLVTVSIDAGQTAWLPHLHKARVRPVMFEIPWPAAADNTAARAVDEFNRTAIQLTK